MRWYMKKRRTDSVKKNTKVPATDNNKAKPFRSGVVAGFW